MLYIMLLEVQVTISVTLRNTLGPSMYDGYKFACIAMSAFKIITNSIKKH